MSMPFLDYLPCDLTRYYQTILPAWRAAHHGKFGPLRELTASAHHLSCWPVFNLPNPLPDASFAGPRSCFGFAYFPHEGGFWPQFLSTRRFPTALREELLQEIEETNELDFWAFCSRHLPDLFGDNAGTEPQTFLLDCLFSTFCCQIPAESMADTRIIGNEGVDLWEEYMARSAEVDALWKGFRQLAPQPLADQLLAPQTYQEFLTELKHKGWSLDYYARQLFVAVHHDAITGFLDQEETIALLTQLPTHERPELNSILELCVRDSGWQENNETLERWPLSPELEKQMRKSNSEGFSRAAAITKAFHASRGDLFQTDKARFLQLEEEHWKALTQAMAERLQEIQALYRAVCAYWNEEYHELFQKSFERNSQGLHQMETEIVARFHYAVEHGWGMIQIRV